MYLFLLNCTLFLFNSFLISDFVLIRKPFSTIRESKRFFFFASLNLTGGYF